MTQTSKMQIDQATVGSGSVGEAFLGGDLTDAGGGLANVVTIRNALPDTADTQVVLLWVPHDSSMTKLDLLGEGNLFQESAHVWKFQPTAGSYDGSWQIRMRETVAGVVQEEIRIFAVLSPKGIRTPALNEIADEDASLLFAGAVAIANSHENEGGNFSGWWRAYRKLVEEVETGGGATAFLGLSDTPGSYAGESLRLARVNVRCRHAGAGSWPSSAGRPGQCRTDRVGVCGACRWPRPDRGEGGQLHGRGE